MHLELLRRQVVLRTSPALRSTPSWRLSRRPLAGHSRPRYLSATPLPPPDQRQSPQASSTPLSSAQPAEEPDAHPPPPPSPSSPPPSERGPSANESSADKLEQLKAHFRELTHSSLQRMREQSDGFTRQVAHTFAQLGSELNRATGYAEIEELKRMVVHQEAKINAAREAAKQAKAAYDGAVRSRAQSQREVNDLLQRKSHWTDEDVGRFTTLVREDHAREQDEARAKGAAGAAEDAVEREFSALMRVILNRYHEEQAWSDKIRSASTYGSLAALALNMAVFVLAIVLVEPWKRRRLAQTFERKVEEMSAATAAAFERRTGELAARLDEQGKLLGLVLETVHMSNRVSSAELAELSSVVEEDPKLPPPLPPSGSGRISTIAQSDQGLLIAVSASAAAAALVGWLARSWCG
ncbi:Mdm33 family-domain-containing protein [Trametes gibbosa]|nr:Mdm33 family-domain-containing protein [Trametes gibbosa]